MARALALWLSTLIAVACSVQDVPPTEGPASQSPAVSTTPSSATPATEVVLRMTVYEPPSPATTREPPEFSLYADGRVIYLQKLAGGGFELRHAELDEAGMSEFTGLAVAALRDAQL
jgi:hypothetical protein